MVNYWLHEPNAGKPNVLSIGDSHYFHAHAQKAPFPASLRLLRWNFCCCCILAIAVLMCLGICTHANKVYFVMKEVFWL